MVAGSSQNMEKSNNLLKIVKRFVQALEDRTNAQELSEHSAIGFSQFVD